MILRIWTKLSTSVRVRDRLCKVTQYSCQMLLGFYVAKMTKETTDMLSLTKYTCSTSRKAFWMFKSLNHLQLMVDMLDCQKLTFKNKDLGLYLIEVFEQFYFILYHWWEAAVFLARCKILDPSQEAAVGRHTNNAWFISDLLGWLATFIKLVRQVNTIYKKYRKLSREQMARVDTGSTMPSTTMVSSPEGETRLEVAPYKAVLNDGSLMVPLFDKCIEITISSLECTVSADFVDIWKKLSGAGLGDGYLGLCGASSSSLMILHTIIKLSREYEEPSK